MFKSKCWITAIFSIYFFFSEDRVTDALLFNHLILVRIRYRAAEERDVVRSVK